MIRCVSEKDEERFLAVRWYLDDQLLQEFQFPDKCFKEKRQDCELISKLFVH